jgi:hypothetical protein
VSFPHPNDIQDHPLRLFDTASGSFDVAGKALAVVNGFVATATRDASRVVGTFKVSIAGSFNAITAQHFKSWLALTLGVGYAQAVALDKAGVARAVVKTAVARATGDLARIGGARIVGARGHTFSILLVESTVALTVVNALDARASRNGHRVGWTRKFGTVGDALAVLLLKSRVALAVIKVVVAASTWDTGGVGRALVIGVAYAFAVLFLETRVALAVIEALDARAPRDGH